MHPLQGTSVCSFQGKFQCGIPAVGVQNPQANIAQFGTAANPLTLTDHDGFTQADPLPYLEQWNFGIQREIAKGTIVGVNYVGTHRVHLPINLPINTVPYTVRPPGRDSRQASAANTASSRSSSSI